MSTEEKQPVVSSPETSPTVPRPKRRAFVWWLQRLFVAGLALMVGLALIVAVGVAQRIGWITSGGPRAASGDAEAEQIYTCSMHPQIRQIGPGTCPLCGMDLVPASSSADLDVLAVTISPAARRLANIETAEVVSGPVIDTIQTVGAIAIDESRMSTIAAYVDGRIERLYADYTGIDVAEGDHLAVLYSPELFDAQVQFLKSRDALNRMTPATLAVVRQAQEQLVENSRHRLDELGMTEEQIADVEETDQAQSRLTIFTDIGGTVIEKLVVEGQYVDAGEPVYRVAGLTTVWLMLEIYPEDAARIRFGQQVEAELHSLPGQAFQGRVAFINRTVDPAKRTVGVRVEFLNDERRLRPGDYATAMIHIPIGQEGDVYDADLAGRWISPMHPQIIRDEPGACPICGMDLVSTTRYGYSETPVEQPESLYVPRSAVLMAGSNSVVYIETDPGRFEIRPVVLGPILQDRVVILGGLRAGEFVATAGNFLIDSQMQLAGKPSLIDPSRAVAAQAGRKVPLVFEHVHVEPVAGEAGEQLEQLYTAYFTIQESLANDTRPPADAAESLHETAIELASGDALPEEFRVELEKIVGPSEHLHHLELPEARESFKPISHIVVTLAAHLRGESAQTPFTHFFCPMVQGGGGDWLQPTDELRNPYFGSKMLNCGELAHGFPTVGHSQGDDEGGDREHTPTESEGGES